MIDRSNELPLTRQAQVLKLIRSGLYYHPQPVSAADLEIMRRMDELHLNYPFAGSRMLRGEGVAIGRAHVITLMKRMRIDAIYRRRNTSRAGAGRKTTTEPAVQLISRTVRSGLRRKPDISALLNGFITAERPWAVQ
jgi:hypothetical protein